MIKYFLMILMVGFSLSCTTDKARNKTIEQPEAKLQTNKEDLFSIDIEQALKNAKQEKFPLSILGSSIEYIPLETTSESLFGGGRHGIEVQVISDKIILFDMKLFDRKTGCYLGDLMKKGQGPKEYIWVLSSAADDEREEVYFYDMSKREIYVVGYNGTFIKSIPCEDYMSLLSLGNGNLLIARGNGLDEMYDDFYVKNVDTEEVLMRRRSPAFENLKSLDDNKNIYVGNQNLCMGDNVYWKYNEDVCYYDYLTDSVYSISKDLKINPVGVFDMGGLKITKEQFAVGALSRDFFVWRISKVLETYDKILINVYASRTKPVHEKKSFLVVYSKGDKGIQAYEYPKESGVYLNDLDNAVSFYPNLVDCTSYYYGLISAETIIERMQKSSNIGSSDFIKMAKKLKYDDNDVIAILK